MKHDAVHAFAVRTVERRFHVTEIFFPHRADAHRALGRNEPTVVDMGGRSGLLDKKALFGPDAMSRRAKPEFPHRDIVLTEVLQGVDRCRMRPSTFGMDAQTILTRQRLETSVVILADQIADGTPEVVQKTIGHVAVFDNQSGDDGQVFGDVVAVGFLEFPG